VLAQDILEHVRDPHATLREIRRGLRADGIALITVINRFAWRDPHYHLYGINWLPRRWGELIVERIGRSKVESARETINALNPDVKVIGYEERLTAANIDRTRPDPHLDLVHDLVRRWIDDADVIGGGLAQPPPGSPGAKTT